MRGCAIWPRKKLQRFLDQIYLTQSCFDSFYSIAVVAVKNISGFMVMILMQTGQIRQTGQHALDRIEQCAIAPASEGNQLHLHFDGHRSPTHILRHVYHTSDAAESGEDWYQGQARSVVARCICCCRAVLTRNASGIQEYGHQLQVCSTWEGLGLLIKLGNLCLSAKLSSTLVRSSQFLTRIRSSFH